MNIQFKRIGKSPQEFTCSEGDVELAGTLETFGHNLVLLKGRIKGHIGLDCDICAAFFEYKLDEEISVLLSDGLYEGENEELDVIECNEGVIDMTEILHSEIELIKSDYHRCQQCQN